MTPPWRWPKGCLAEEAFVQHMNATAQRLGMRNTVTATRGAHRARPRHHRVTNSPQTTRLLADFRNMWAFTLKGIPLPSTLGGNANSPVCC